MTRAFDLSTYLVADLATIGDRDPVDVVRRAVDGGATIVQIRGKDVPTARLLDVLVACAEAIGSRAALVVDDRVDVFLAARAAGAAVDGVHVGQSDLPVAAVRALVGPDAIVGLSAGTPDELEAVRGLPAGTVDYLGVGAVRATPTKPDHPDPLGWEGVARVVGAAGGLPCVAIGGVGPGDAASARAAGAAGLAVVRAICRADDPAQAAGALADEWRRAGARIPNVLSIAGSDPSGGAGVQADLKTILALGGYGMAAVTALTAQNTHGVRGVHVPSADFLRAQLDAVSDDIAIDAVKVGMLGTADVIREVVAWLSSLEQRPAVVVDPVMVATSGDRLLDADAESALASLLDLADVVTPNLPELAALAGEPAAERWDDALAQARALASRHGVRVLAKGGHLEGAACPDALVGPRGVEIELAGERIPTAHTHGTGCTLSSALATAYARERDWAAAARTARAWVRDAIRAGAALDVGSPGGSGPLDHGHALRDDRRPGAELEAWWEDIADVRRGIAGDDFVAGLASGTLDEARFSHYLRQDALYLDAYAEVLRAAARLAPSADERAFWDAAAVSCIETEQELHRSRGAAGAGEMSEVTAEYTRHLRRAADDGDYAVLVAAVLPCFWVYDDVGRALAASNRPDHPYRDWLETYDDPAFRAATLEAIRWTQGAARRASGPQLARMRAAFRRSAELEREFFAQREAAQLPA